MLKALLRKLLCATSVLVVLSRLLIAQDSEPPEPASTELQQAIQNEQSAFLVRAAVDRPSRAYREGDALYVTACCEVDAYVYLFYEQADGALRVIFPNAAQRDNYVAAGQTVRVPAEDDLFRWVVGPPFGKEVIKVVATKEPLPRIDALAAKGRFNPVSESQLQTLTAQLKDATGQRWAESEVEIMTYPRSHSPEPPAGYRPKRFGVFFGVSKYQFDEEFRLATEGKGHLDLVNGHNDAIKLAEAFSSVGRLDDSRVYVNQQATRRRIELAVKQWLPSVSRPGDTVFIHFTGHGVKVPDNDGDEADGLDEVLLPHDTVDINVLLGLLKKVEQGEQVDLRFERWIQMASRLGPQRADAALVRETAISDDLFGRWLQRLDGRRVIVILGSCYGGGFSDAAEGAVAKGEEGAFDFLDGEISRLKDIGQREQALLTSALSTQEARDFHAMGMTLMPYVLRAIMLKADGPLTLEQAHAFCKNEMAHLYEMINRERRDEGKETIKPHEPYLMNYCSETVFLRL